MYARFIRYIFWPDKVDKLKPVPRNPGLDFPVYCKNCDYLSASIDGVPEHFHCWHTSNKLVVPSDKSWYSSDERHAYIQSPKQKNAKNNCNYFSRKIG